MSFIQGQLLLFAMILYRGWAQNWAQPLRHVISIYRFVFYAESLCEDLLFFRWQKL